MLRNSNIGHAQPFCALGLRLKKDISELNEFQTCEFNRSATLAVEFQNVPNLKFSRLQLNISVKEGPYRGGQFVFTIDILETYPFKAPEIYSRYPLWHPNIEILTGRVHLPLEWSPVLTLKALALAIQLLLLEPCVSSPVNIQAAAVYDSDPLSYDIQIQTILRGGIFFGIKFAVCLSSAYLKIVSCKRKLEDKGDSASSIDGRDADDMDLGAEDVPVEQSVVVDGCEVDADCVEAMVGVHLFDSDEGEDVDSSPSESKLSTIPAKRPRLRGRNAENINLT